VITRVLIGCSYHVSGIPERGNEQSLSVTRADHGGDLHSARYASCARGFAHARGDIDTPFSGVLSDNQSWV